MPFMTLTLILFLIMDPIGNVSSFLTMVKGIEPKRQKFIVIREMLFALCFMLFFNFFGEFIFSLLQISETTVKIASGVILFIVSVQILFPQLHGIREGIAEGEPFIIPLAIPLIAGPSLLATIMLYARTEASISKMLFAIFIAWVLASLVLLSAGPLQRLLGRSGLMACEKLMGMVLVLLAVQRFLDGVTLCYQNCTP